MRRAFCCLILTISSHLATAQLQSDAIQPEPRVVDRGPHHRVVETYRYETDAGGRQLISTNSYQELSTGLHYFENGAWNDSKDEIELFNNGAVARHGQHKVIFAPNCNTSVAIDMELPDGVRMQTHVLGIAYFDAATGNNVLIAEVKDSVGELIPPNQIIYRNAFTDIEADIRYTWTKSGFEQDVILHQSLASPSTYGLKDATSQLQVLTEFVDSPVPEKLVGKDLSDEQLTFGAIKMTKGHAFSTFGSGTALPVSKQYRNLQGRNFLIEWLPYLTAKAEMQALPVAARQDTNRTVVQVSKKLRLPVVQTKRAKEPIRLAANPRVDGFVLDYTALLSDTNFTFKANSTYYASGQVNLSGTNTLERQAVIKFAAGAQIKLLGSLNCTAEQFAPAIFTAKDDDTVGEKISGSTGNPSGYYGSPALFLDSVTSGATYSLQNIRINYAKTGVLFSGGTGHLLGHAQLTYSEKSLEATNSQFSLRNVLFYNALTNINGSSFTGICEHVTIDNANQLAADTVNSANSVLFITNSILCAITNGSSVLLNTNTVPSFASGSQVFQTAGAGRHYLQANSALRNSGVTNISPSLLNDFKQRTTFPPLLISNQVFQFDTTLTPQASRDLGIPDIGYLYDPLDYLFAKVSIASCSVVLTNGVVIGYWGPMVYLNGGNLVSEGAPNRLNRIVHRLDVQEQPTANFFYTGFFSAHTNRQILVSESSVTIATSQLHLRFTSLQGHAFFITQIGSNFSQFEFKDCQIMGGTLQRFCPNSTNVMTGTMGITNNIFSDTASISLGAGSATLTTDIRNNLFLRSCGISINTGTSPSATINDNLFDQGSFTGGSSYSIYDYNIFTPGAGHGTAHFIENSNLVYYAGPLGKYYLAASDVGIDWGSRNATNAGFAHYTSTTNQVLDTLVVNNGFHYVAVDLTTELPLDTDGDGIPDYLEDRNGNGAYESATETDWTTFTASDGLISGVTGLKVYTPLK